MNIKIGSFELNYDEGYTLVATLITMVALVVGYAIKRSFDENEAYIKAGYEDRIMTAPGAMPCRVKVKAEVKP